jgi:RNA polymerase sigma-70 factor (ECF subfamily)
LSQTKEQELVAKIKQGLPGAFEELVYSYEKMVYRIAYRFFGNENDALDASQEVFIRVFRAFQAFEGRSSLKTWIYRIASNTCISISEKKKAEKEGFLKLVTHWLSTRIAPSHEERVLEKEERRQNKELVANALTAVPEIYRMPVILKDLEGLGMDEIAKALEIPLGTVKSRLNRGRGILRELLKWDAKE